MKRVGTLLILLLIVGLTYYGYSFIQYRRANAVSDAAFIRSDSLTMVAFKVGGKVLSMEKEEGEQVEEGEVLARLDDRDYRIARERIEREIEALSQKIGGVTARSRRLERELSIKVEMSRSRYGALKERVGALKNKIAALEERRRKLELDTARFRRLWRERLIARSDFEKVATEKGYLDREIAALQKELGAQIKGLREAELAIDYAESEKGLLQELERELEGLKKKREALGKELEAVERKIGYCTLRSPLTGRVAKRFVGRDRVVGKGSPIYALVDPKELHLEVLLSERKLRGVRVGNPVEIEVDAFPDRIYHGVVESILPTSAATFALVPRDISSGEFTKLDQRFTVRIRLLDPTDDLRVGMGASVAIARKE
ncbi:MAG: HlyD family efflux transporter periplasmic adaptor subunit [Epsilonproteobacteria bacterium]|nr:hypothetical protein [Campylobacterota bacterium]NPA56469.1 HlyD family efflux transporter periplasmic adaptor subunit [Campylobacterota bacterium]